MIGSCARVLWQLAEVDLAEVHPRAQHARHAGDRALDPMLGQKRLDLHQRGPAVTALERLHDDVGLRALDDQHAAPSTHVAGGDPGVGQHPACDHALLRGLNLLAGDLGVVLERRRHHVVAHPRRRRTVGQPAVIDRVDLATRLLDALDHLELHLQ
jgi:hypothetical protein